MRFLTGGMRIVIGALCRFKNLAKKLKWKDLVCPCFIESSDKLYIDAEIFSFSYFSPGQCLRGGHG